MRTSLSTEDSGNTINLKEIQENTNKEPVVDTSSRHETKNEESVVLNDISMPLRISKRMRIPLEFYGFHIVVDSDELLSDGALNNLDELSTYSEAMAGPESVKWKGAMDIEIQSMYDHQVRNLVDLQPSLKTMGCK